MRSNVYFEECRCRIEFNCPAPHVILAPSMLLTIVRNVRIAFSTILDNRCHIIRSRACRVGQCVSQMKSFIHLAVLLRRSKSPRYTYRSHLDLALTSKFFIRPTVIIAMQFYIFSAWYCWNVLNQFKCCLMFKVFVGRHSVDRFSKISFKNPIDKSLPSTRGVPTFVIVRIAMNGSDRTSIQLRTDLCILAKNQFSTILCPAKYANVYLR